MPQSAFYQEQKQIAARAALFFAEDERVRARFYQKMQDDSVAAPPLPQHFFQRCAFLSGYLTSGVLCAVAAQLPQPKAHAPTLDHLIDRLTDTIAQDSLEGLRQFLRPLVVAAYAMLREEKPPAL